MDNKFNWTPPNKNCGLCGENSCEKFVEKMNNNSKVAYDCPYFQDNSVSVYHEYEANFDVWDVHGTKFDFLLKAIGNEKSARKIIRPFRADLIERYNIKKGDIVMGRPMGAGCPVTHVLEVYEVDEITGVLYTWAVGPKAAREGRVIDIRAYAMTGFEGIATNVVKEPKVGKTAGFMPGFCMLRLTHYGLVNMVLDTKDGYLVRIEDIHIARAQQLNL